MSIYGIKMPDGSMQRLTTFAALKENIIAATRPVTRLLDRLIANKLPVSEAMLRDMRAQIEAIETFIDRLVETEPKKLQGKANVAKSVTGEVLSPTAKIPQTRLIK
jgi:hypothetical protein